MWTKFSHFILRNRLFLILLLLSITAVMGYLGRGVQMAYDYAKVVPADDPDMIYYQSFKNTFGEDGNIMAIGMKDSSIYEYEKFNKLQTLKESFAGMEGITEVISVHDLPVLIKNMEEKRFETEPLFKEAPDSQEALDSLLAIFFDTKFYEDQFVNSENGAMLFLVSMNDEYLNSKKRLQLVDDLIERGKVFEEETGITLHYAGLPYLRSVLAGKVKAELEMFLAISVAITALILFLFFRSFSPMFYSLIVIGMVVVWTMGFLVLFGYKMTMLTGLLPPILVVIGIPNCIYLLNKYHQEFAAHGNKAKALSMVIRKIGAVTLITNATTAIGFVVLTSTSITIMKEFGTLASVSILSTFFISITFIPAVFSYLPDPKRRHVRHLEFKPINAILKAFDIIVNKYRPVVYGVTIVIVVVAFYGATKVEALTYMMDDLPEKSELKQDLYFFENNFSGVMPLEIVINTGKKRGIRKRSVQKKVNQIQNYLDSIEVATRPVSLLSFIKAANQAFWDGNPKKFKYPQTKRELNNVLLFLKNQQDSSGLVSSFVDEHEESIRISMKIADIGSKKLDSLVYSEIEPRLTSILADTGLEAKITGTTLIYIKGNDYLIGNLRMSMLIA
ncbi:MAG: efflux RND transporter permease subunit, partial [Flammeovirgaceae bacterium]